MLPSPWPRRTLSMRQTPGKREAEFSFHWEEEMPPQRTALKRVAKVVAGSVARHRAEMTGAPLLVAVSGGPDSSALLLAVMALPQGERPPVMVVHFSHGLRPRAEVREAALVEALAASWNVPVIRGRAAPGKFSRPRGGSVEAAARAARHAFFSETARHHGARAVALGHTLDDQAETVLLRLARGTGLRGLGAMREWSTWAAPETATPLQLFRPLLAVTRDETEAVCAEAGIVPARDSSNSSLAFARNRVRHRVLHELEHLNPEVRAALASFALTAQQDDDLLQALAGSSVEGHAARDGSAVTWPRALLTDMPGPLLVRVFQTAWEAACQPGAALSKAHLDAMAGLIASPLVRQVRLPHGMTFSVAGGGCRLGPVPFVEHPSGGPFLLAIPGLSQAGLWCVEVQERVASSLAEGLGQPAGDPWRASLDADQVGTPLSLRSRRPGDRFHPKGMAGPKRLQDFYVDAKVPRDQRDAVPLLVGPKGIAWVVGHRMAAWASVGPATRRVLDIAVRRTESE